MLKISKLHKNWDLKKVKLFKILSCLKNFYFQFPNLSEKKLQLQSLFGQLLQHKFYISIIKDYKIKINFYQRKWLKCLVWKRTRFFFLLQYVFVSQKNYIFVSRKFWKTPTSVSGHLRKEQARLIGIKTFYLTKKWSDSTRTQTWADNSSKWWPFIHFLA